MQARISTSDDPSCAALVYVTYVIPIQMISSWYAGVLREHHTYADNLVIFPTRPPWTDPIITQSTKSADISPKSVTQEDQALHFRMRKHQRQPKRVLTRKENKQRCPENDRKGARFEKACCYTRVTCEKA